MEPTMEEDELHVENQPESTIEETVEFETLEEAEGWYRHYANIPNTEGSEEKANPTEFKTLEEAEQWYLIHARKTGFGVRRETRRKRVDGRICSYTWVCSKQGQRDPKYDDPIWKDNKQRRRPETRVGCLARFRVTYSRDFDKCEMKYFNDEHCHSLVPASLRHFVRSFRKVPECDADLARTMKQAGIGITQIYDVIAIQNGGYENTPYQKKDLYNRMNEDRSMYDAEAALTYMSAKEVHDPEFFYKHEIDETGRLCRLLWIDGISRFDYSTYGDVLVMDSTYKSNNYGQPLVLIGGINNHHKTLLFGFALIHDETVPTYTWVLTHFRAAMKDNYPSSIVTDGDRQMAAAIATVFPKTKHRLCGWHIMKNVEGQVFKEGFMSELSKLVFDYMPKEEFESRFKQLLSQHDLENHKYIKDELCPKREFWSAAHNRGYFFGEAQTTQRIEGMNAKVKSRVSSKLSIRELLMYVDIMLQKTRLIQDEADYKELTEKPIMKTTLKKIEKHGHSIFTPESMNRIIKQIELMSGVFVDSTEEVTENEKTYTVQEYDGWSWKVMYKRDMGDREEVNCECKYFETVGFPCKHAFEVMKCRGMIKIPDNLINHRWAKKPIINRQLLTKKGQYVVPETEEERASLLLSAARRSIQFAKKNPDRETFISNLKTLFSIGEPNKAQLKRTNTRNSHMSHAPRVLNPQPSTKKRRKYGRRHQQRSHPPIVEKAHQETDSASTINKEPDISSVPPPCSQPPEKIILQGTITTSTSELDPQTCTEPDPAPGLYPFQQTSPLNMPFSYADWSYFKTTRSP